MMAEAEDLVQPFSEEQMNLSVLTKDLEKHLETDLITSLSVPKLGKRTMFPNRIAQVLRQTMRPALMHHKIWRDAPLPCSVLKADIRTKVVLATLAKITSPASNYRFNSNPISRLEVFYIFINLYKTMHSDPHHIYLAVSRNIDDSTLAHELAHVLDYLGGSNQAPGTMEPLGLEVGIPVDHLEHPEEYGYWLDYLKNRFDVRLDADDFIISYLYQNGMLIRAQEIKERNAFILKTKSDRILKFLGEHSEEIDALIRGLPGYIGARKVND